MSDNEEASESNGPKLKDIADAAGVSVASVSKVLNNRGGVGTESRQRILDAADRFGYQRNPARKLKRAGIENTVFIIPARYYSHSQFYEDVIRGVLEEASTRSLKIDVRLVSLEPNQFSDELDAIMKDIQPGALLVLGLDHPVVIDRIVATQLPVILVNGMDRTMRLTCVLPDNWSAGWLATERLLRAGHRKIMHIAMPTRLTIRRRLEGFRSALEEADIAFDRERHVFDLQTRGVAESEAQGAIRTALLAGEFAETTAFYCGTDLIALGLMQALSDEGLSVPRDYSIVGHDDISIARHSRPPLTTVQIDRIALGRASVQQLIALVGEPENLVRRVNIGVRLVERGSVDRPRGTGSRRQ